MPRKRKALESDEDPRPLTLPDDTELGVAVLLSLGPESGSRVTSLILTFAERYRDREREIAALLGPYVEALLAALDDLDELEDPDPWIRGPLPPEERWRLEDERFDPIVFSPRSAGRA